MKKVMHQTSFFSNPSGSASKTFSTRKKPSKKRLSFDISDEELRSYLEKNSAHITEDFPTEIKKQISEIAPYIFYKGDISLFKKPIVSVVGTRSPSENGIKRTQAAVEAICKNGYVVMSGLAKGIDRVAHETSLKCKGKTIAVFGTPIHYKVYPVAHKKLAEEIVLSGLLLSPSLPFEETGQYLFPRRNKLMATLSLATIIVQAGETSGVVHQAAECTRQGKKLIFLKSLVEQSYKWIQDFIKSGALVAENSDHLISLIKD